MRYRIKQKVMAFITCVAMVIPFLSPFTLSFAREERKSPLGIVATSTDAKEEGGYYTLRLKNVEKYNVAGIQYEVFADRKCTKKLKSFSFSYNGYAYQTKYEKPVIIKSGNIKEEKYYSQSDYLPYGTYYFKQSITLYSDTEEEILAETLGYKVDETIGSFNITKKNSKIQDILIVDINNKTDVLEDETSKYTSKGGEVTNIATPTDASDKTLVPLFLDSKRLKSMAVELMVANNNIYITYNGSATSGLTIVPDFTSSLGRVYCGDHFNNNVPGTNTYSYSEYNNNDLRKVLLYANKLSNSDADIVKISLAVNNAVGSKHHSGGDEILNAARTEYPGTLITAEQSELSLTVDGKTKNSISIKAETIKTIDEKEMKVSPKITLNGNSNNSISIKLPTNVWLKSSNEWHKSGTVTLKGGQSFYFAVPKNSTKTYKFLDLDGKTGCTAYKLETGASQELYFGITDSDSVSITLTGAEIETPYYMYLTKNGATKSGDGVKAPYNAAGITYDVKNSNDEKVGRFVCSYNGYCYADADGNVLIFKNKAALDNYKTKNEKVYTQFVEVEETGTYSFTELTYLREFNSKGKLVRSNKLVSSTGLIINDNPGSVKVRESNNKKDTAVAAHFSATDEEGRGSLMITKADSKTKKPVEGAIYTVYSGTTSNNNNIVARFKTDTNGVGIVQASPLSYKRKTTNVTNDTLYDMPIGKYCIKETFSPIDYEIDEKLYQVEVTTNNYSEPVMKDFTDDCKDDPVNIFINKVDADGNSKDAGGASLANAQFEICLYSLTDNNRKYFTKADELKSAKLTEKWIVKTIYDKNLKSYRATLDNKHIVSGRKFDGEPRIPLGTITIREVIAPEGYMTVTGDNHGSVAFAKRDENGNYVTNENGQIIKETISTDSFIGQLKEVDGGASVFYNNEMSGNYLDIYEPVQRGDIKFRKVDEKDKAMAGIVFAITSNTTGETHYVVTDENGEFDSSKLTNTKNTNQNDSLVSPSAQNGVWFFGSNDKDNWDYTKVSDDRGAFVFDTYTITEIECDGNKGKQLATDVEVSVDANGEVFNAGKMVNVPEPVIKTKAYNAKTGLQMADKLEVVDITDEVSYEYLEAGKSYTIKGIVMTDDGKAFMNNGKPVTSLIPFTTKKDTNTETNYMAKGTEKLNFAVDTTLADRNLVIYEYLFEGKDETPLTVNKDGSVVTDGVLKDREGNLICHADKTDKNQTINILSLKTKAWATSSGCNRVQASKNTEINDTLYYNGLTVGKTYQITSKIMFADDKGIKEVVSKTEDYTPTTESGEVTITFDKFDTTPYAGKKFTIYETLTLNGKLIVEETSIDNEDQTVHLVTLQTTLKDKVTDEHISFAGKEVTLVDTVSYTNLNIGKKYTLDGTLIDKATGKEILDAAGNPIKASTTFVAKQKNGKVEVVFKFDASLLEGKTTVAFESLKHDGKEVAFHKDINDDDQTVKFPKGRTTAKSDKSQTHVAFPDKKVTVIDTVSYENLLTGKEYSITGAIYINDGGKAKALVINGEKVTATTKFTADTANGSVDIKFTFDASALIGKSIVVFENCYYKGKLVFTHADIEDKNQTIYFPQLETFAANKADGSKILVKDKVNTITDTIKYKKFDSSETYTVKGVLMDKNTGKAVVNNGKQVEAVKTFTPSGDDIFVDGAVSMDFTVDTTGYGGHVFVVYEYVYSSNGTLIAEHTDLTSVDQSVSIPTQVKTGDNSPIKIALIIMLVVLMLASILIFVRRKINRR